MTTYDQDVVAWANEQAALLRAGRFSALDLEHLADEIEDVGKSEQRELVNRMAVLLAHLLKWQFQPVLRGASWRHTVAVQREDVVDLLNEAPSLRAKFHDAAWSQRVWNKSVDGAAKETGIAIDVFPVACPWTMEQALNDAFWPD